jgi:hypothetical protein
MRAHPPLPPARLATPRHDAVCGIVPRCRAYLIFLLFGKIIARLISYQRFPVFSDRGLRPTSYPTGYI